MSQTDEELLKELILWEQRMGGFDSPVWDKVKRRLDRGDLIERPRARAFPQEQAVNEGWCVIDRGHCFEIQKDDDQSEFPTDGMARAYVMEQADEGSNYHLNALAYVTHENTRLVREGVECAGTDGFIFLWKRTWQNEAVTHRTIVKARAYYDPAEGPYSDALYETVGSNEDVVDLEESNAIPDVTFDTGAFKFTGMAVHTDIEDYPVGCTCGACGNKFPIDPALEENLKTVLSEGCRINVARCTKCGALAHNPKKR